MGYTYEQVKRKLENTLRVFRTQKNSNILDSMIKEILEKIGFNIIAESTVKELRSSFKQQNFSCWNNILELDHNKKYY